MVPACRKLYFVFALGLLGDLLANCFDFLCVKIWKLSGIFGVLGRYGMMLACWSQTPEDRPDFSQLLQQLQLLISPKENEDDPSCQLLNNSVDISGSTEYLEVIG